MGAGPVSSARQTEDGRVPPWVGPTVLLLLAGFFIGVVFWGRFNPMDVDVEYFDAGRADAFEIGQLVAYPDIAIYIVGMEDGRLRAIDGRIDGGCTVTWLPQDERGRAYNPGGQPGVFEDPCTGATWSMIANAIQGADEPLRTPYIDYKQPPDHSGVHAYIERVNP